MKITNLKIRKKYSIKRTIVKAVKYLVIFVVPALFNHFAGLYPDYWNLPIGAVIVAVWNFIKFNYLIK